MDIVSLLTKGLKNLLGVRVGRGMLLTGLIIVLSVVFIAVLAPWVAPYDPTRSVGKPFQPPSLAHLFGTNRLGQDMFSRIVYGSQIILMVVISATVISMSVGIPLGLMSGYIGGLLDRVMSMIMDSIYAFPSLVLAIAIAAMLGPSITNTTVAISIVYIPTYFRMVRGQTLSLKEQLFVEAARALGARDREIMLRYILPNLAPTIIVVFSLSVADAILTEAGLSFLGLSVVPPTPDWGYDLRVGQPFLLNGFWWLVFFPGLMVMLLAMGFAFIGEGLGERFALGGER